MDQYQFNEHNPNDQTPVTKTDGIYKDKDVVWKGEYSNETGLAHGRGTQIEGRNLYEGWWKDGMRNGHGRMIWATGEVYEGSWKDDMRDGYGTNTWHHVGKTE